MKRKRGRITISDLYCTECGLHMTVPRRRSKQRGRGHLKKLYCCKCREEKNFVEVREKDFSLQNVI